MRLRDKRTFQRSRVKWRAECRAPSGVKLEGLIKDVNTFGMFFEPKRDQQRSTFYNRLRMGNFIEGDRVIVTFSRSEGSRAESMLATLRWKGHSEDHDCAGFGVEVER